MARIMLVDDDDEFRSAIGTLLRKAGYDVDEAVDGEDAVRLYHETPADLVITDIMMPRKDGLETIMELWRDFPDVRVIAISGGTADVPPELCLQYAEVFGAIKTFRKPVRAEELLAAVREQLDGQSA